jgi:hypothetical protein
MRLALLLAVVPFASGEEDREFFTLVGRVCVPSWHEEQSEPKVAASPSECRLWCAQQPTCKTVQVTLEGATAMCELYTSFENSHGACSSTSCCYYKGIPPQPINSGATIWATDSDDRPLAEQMGAEHFSDQYRTVSLPLMLCVTCAAMLLLGSVSVYVSHKRRRAAAAAAAVSRNAQADLSLALRKQVDALPTTVCFTRGFVACLGKFSGGDVEMGCAPAPTDRSGAEAAPRASSSSILSRSVGLEVLPSLLSKALRTFSAGEASPAAKTRGEDDDCDECALCMAVYEPGDAVRHLPCKHFFHKTCVDRWLTGGAGRSCPLCKADPFERSPRLTTVVSCPSTDTSFHTVPSSNSVHSSGSDSPAGRASSPTSPASPRDGSRGTESNYVHSSSSVHSSVPDSGRDNPPTSPSSPRIDSAGAAHDDAPASAASGNASVGAAAASTEVAPATPTVSPAIVSDAI